MCWFGGSQKVESYKQSAQSRTPDNGSAYSDAARRASDRIRAGTSTILTGAGGVSDSSITQKKTILGG